MTRVSSSFVYISILLFFLVSITVNCKKSDDSSNTPASETVKDFDGNIYHTVKIGSQVWMVENLSVTHYRNGDPVTLITDSNQWLAADSGAYCNYNNDASLVHTYGRLYNWHAVNDGRFLSPAGWHIPTDEEWKALEMYLGMTQAQADSVFYRGTTEGGELKETGISHWIAPNDGATNSSGFTALPGGYRAYLFTDLYSSGCWWTSSKASADEAIFRVLSYVRAGIVRNAYHQDETLGLSVRCIKD